MVADDRDSSRTAGLVWLLALLAGLYVGGSPYADAGATLSLIALTPVAAAWVTQRFGPGAIAPLLLWSLLPAIRWGITDALWLGYASADTPVVAVAIVLGGLWAAQRAPEVWRPLIRHDRLWRLVPAAALFWVEASQWPFLPEIELSRGLSLTVSVLDGAGALAVVSIVDWHVVARHRGLRLGLPVLLVASAALQPSLLIDPVALNWGSSWPRGWLVGLAFVAALTGAIKHPRGLVAFGLIALLEALRIALHWPAPTGWIADTPAAASSNELIGRFGSEACDVASAALLSWALLRYLLGGDRAARMRLALALGSIAVLQLGFAPAMDAQRGVFLAGGTGGWLIGGAAWVAGLVWGGRGLLAAPLPLLAVAALVSLVATHPSPLAFIVDAGAIACVAGMNAFVGWCTGRTTKADDAMSPSAQRVIDIGRLARFVRRLDTSATLRSFAALLIVLGVAYKLAQMSAFAMIIHAFDADADVDVAHLVLVWGLVVLLVLTPLGFIGIDAINRQDRWRPASMLTGATLAGLGWAGVTGGIAALVLSQSLDDWRALARFDRQAAIDFALQLLAEVLSFALALVFIVRGVRLRVGLSTALPRGLLFGEITGGGFWPRLAFLMGLPSSMWRRSALRQAAFWAFLGSRPLIYVGAYGLAQGDFALGALALVAGHGLFVAGKRLAAREIWRLGVDDAAPVLFLRSFEDDQFDFQRQTRNPLRRWLALWSFRRNLDETLVDEVARYGRVLALGRPGETTIPFGSERYYSTHDDWQRVITDTARRAHSIVVVAGDTGGVLWEYGLLAREGLLDRTLLIFRPGAEAGAANRTALAAFPLDGASHADLDADATPLVALLHLSGQPVLLTAAQPDPAGYVVALRAHFQRCQAATFARAALIAGSA